MSSPLDVLLGFLGPVAALLLLITPLIVIHELGHLWAARWRGVDAPEFGIGFPPRVATIYRGRQTVYTLNAIPFGGFVRLAGAEEGSSDPAGWERASLGSKISIMVAGVLMNLVFAIAVLTVVHGPLAERAEVSIAAVEQGSPAAAAGIRAGDRIIAIDGAPLDRSGPLLGALRDAAGQDARIGLRGADGTARDIVVRLRTIAEAEGRGVLGVQIGEVTGAGPLGRDLPTAVGVAVGESASTAAGLIGALGRLVSAPFVGGEGAGLSGPIGLSVAVAENAGRIGLVGLLHLAGLLSINLAVLNILPIPPLDGGRVATSLLRHALGERRGRIAERRIVAVGVALMLLLFVAVTAGDLLSLFGGG